MAFYPGITITSSDTATSDNYVYYLNATGGSLTLTLPEIFFSDENQNIDNDGMAVCCKRVDSAVLNSVTISPSGTDTVNNAGSYSLLLNNSVELVANRTRSNWERLSSL